MTTFRDSTDPRDVPPSDIVGGYGDGDWNWSPSWYDGSNGWDLHPEAHHLVFVVNAQDQGDGLDVENGDAMPSDAPGWVERWNRQTGWRAAMLYCNRDYWPQVVDYLRAAGIDPAGPLVDYLISTLDGTVEVRVPDGAKPPVAVQSRGSDLTGGHYDEWAVLDPDWALGRFPAPPAPAPAPVPAPPPASIPAPRRGTMVTVDYTNQVHVFWIDANGTPQHRWYPAPRDWAADTTAPAAAGMFVPGTLLSTDLSFGQLHLYGLAKSARLGHIWWDGAKWQYQEL